MPDMQPDLLIGKLYFVLLSMIGFVTSLVVLKVFRPDMSWRAAMVSLSAVILIFGILKSGDLFSVEPLPGVPVYHGLKEAAWLALGVLFGMGRGDFIINYLDKRDLEHYQKTKAEKLEIAESTEKSAEKSEDK
ncbi:MAG: hypothetical protein K2Y32_09900 [Candidatus Obscuribacterales bacterium]|nr:hypothetical protein [Candidatus Obscuribacterales bacterium]